MKKNDEFVIVTYCGNTSIAEILLLIFEKIKKK